MLTTICRAVASPTNRVNRSRISSAALLVNVMASRRCGETPFSRSRYAMRCVNVRVLPVPGPATIISDDSTHDAASRCSGFNPASISPSCVSKTGFPAWAGQGVGNCCFPTTCPSHAGMFAVVFFGRDGMPRSSGRKSRMTPNSPSYPASAMTCPARIRRIPSASNSPPAFVTSSSGMSRRIVTSAPSFVSSDSYANATFFEASEVLYISARISGSGIRL